MRTALLSLLCGIIFIGAFSWGAQAQATERKLITPNTANSTEKSQVSTDSITSIPTFTLKGQVTDVYGQPIPHAYVLYDDEKSGGIVTDSYGHFSIQVYAYQRILFKHGSYVPQTIVAQPGDSLVQIKMYPEAYHLKDAVITAVSQNKKIQYGETELGVCGEFDNTPEFPGGDLPGYIQKRLCYPESARAAGIEGRVVVSFIIDTEGNVTHPCVVKSVCDALDAEAIRVISLLPRWKPAVHRGKRVPFRYTIGIDFKLKTAGHTQADTLPSPGR